ncbi:rod-determining factor RdfA [Halorussus sp. AFM4]|uniref:rod-determining factor RdfA n=1 Tax=Halorussus sp. AFM4 TaxID=3421651 RepID=UPI003EBA8CC7
MGSHEDGCGCKIARVTGGYDLPDVDTWLVDEWQTGTSVRRLTEALNKDIIESALIAANVEQVDRNRDAVYEALHTDELSNTETIEIQRELERAGVDVEQLSADLVSHQTVYRHLTNCLDASKDDEKTPEERRKTARDTVYALQQRTELVTESTVESLRSADITNLGDTEVLVDIQVVCSDCGRSLDFETAIQEGCRCDSP